MTASNDRKVLRKWLKYYKGASVEVVEGVEPANDEDLLILRRLLGLHVIHDQVAGSPDAEPLVRLLQRVVVRASREWEPPAW